MDFEYSNTFTLYNKDGKKVPLKYTTKTELTTELGKYLKNGTKYVPVISITGLTSELRPIRVLESIKIIWISSFVCKDLNNIWSNHQNIIFDDYQIL